MAKFRRGWVPIWGDIPFRTRVVILGVGLTAFVVGLGVTGGLEPFENWLYDTRAQRCQFFGKAPTTQLVHLDITDGTVETFGRWPWLRGRRIIAGVIDELREAGAEAVALDILLSDRDQNDDSIDWNSGGPTTAPAGTLPATGPATRVSAAEAARAAAALRKEDTEELAQAVQQFGRVVLPTNFSLKLARETELDRVVREQLRSNLEMTPDQMAQWLNRYGGRKLKNVPPEKLLDTLLNARKAVALEKLMVAPNQPVEELLPNETRGGAVVTSPLIKLVDRKREQARSILMMEKLFSREVPTDLPDLLVTVDQMPPLESVTRAILRGRASGSAMGMIGSAEAAKEALAPDGVVRQVPLLVNDRGHLLPQLGLALACTVLGVDPTNREEFVVSPDQIVLSPPGREPVTIPISTHPAGGGRPAVGATFTIPWFGSSDWKTMYDWPRHQAVVNHFPLTDATVIAEKRANLRRNEANEAKAGPDIATLREIGGLGPPGPNAPFDKVVKETLEQAKTALDDIRKMSEEEVRQDRSLQRVLEAANNLTTLVENRSALERELEESKAKLRQKVNGKVVVVGYAASSAGDTVPTSMHGSCPGAVVHGAVFNAIITGNLWWVAPRWIPYVLAILFGALMTWAVAKLTPTASTLVAVVLAGAYVVLNGVVLFDRYDVVLGAAAPLSAIGLVWAGCTAASAGERFRINQMLHGYVDPKLVNYLNEHPENELFETKTQEVTVCFSDIAGFTTMTQQLGERMIPLLQDYLSRMVAVIRRHGGVVNKFMGDGIMFIFGVPEREAAARHAEEALRCCLEMQEALARFNEEHAPEGFPALRMRCGVNTGTAYVGDAGPAEAREYTALGDTTNLAARLEPANKEFETRILVTEATYLQTLNSFLFIPVGKLQVRGRQEGTMTYELLCRTDDGDEECRQGAEAMQAMILSYQQGVFDGCLKLIAQFEGRFGANRACAIYRGLCERYLQDGTPADFHGQVRIG